MIHQFQHNGVNIVLDVASGAVHQVDELGYALCAKLEAPLSEACPAALLREMEGDYAREEIEETYGELYALFREGLLFSEDLPVPADLVKPENTPVKALCLHVAHDCNLRCRYCFASTGDYGNARALMSSETAKRAIDFVIEKSQKRRNIEIDFFGGEPLMAWQTVKDTVAYADEQGKLHGKNFRYTVTTNGMLLTDEISDYINEHMCNVVLSVDGRKAIHDEMRPTPSGKGSYDIIMPKFQKLVERRSPDKDYYMRGTYTAKNLDFAQDVLDLYRQGFDQLSMEPVVAPEGCGYELKEGDLPRLREEYWYLADRILELDDKGEFLNFFHFNVSLDQGPCIIKRLRGCGAGCEYVAVTPEGDVYPCHQFAGDESFRMGNILDGSFDPKKASAFAGVSVYTRQPCGECWARYYCSGGCSAANFHANGDINKCYDMACKLEQMRLECAIYLAVVRAGEEEADASA
jgi:uncharacterized protein